MCIVRNIFNILCRCNILFFLAYQKMARSNTSADIKPENSIYAYAKKMFLVIKTATTQNIPKLDSSHF